MEDVVEIPGDEAGRQVAGRDAKAIRVDRVRRKQPLLNGSRELEFLLRELRFLQALDALAQTLLQDPEEIEDEPEKEAEQARDAERDADVPRGEVEPCQPRCLREEGCYAKAEGATEKEDDRGNNWTRKDLAPAD